MPKPTPVMPIEFIPQNNIIPRCFSKMKKWDLIHYD